MASIVGPNSIIQSDFTTDGVHGNLEAVLLINGSIQHLTGVPPKSGALVWSLHDTLPAAATGPASIIQSRYGIVTHGNYEVVLLASDGLWHWRFDNSKPASSWVRVGLVSAHATGPGSIIQSSLGPVGNLEVVVPEGNQLWHYTLDGSNPAASWQKVDLVTADSTGPGCIIQSNLGSPGNFEVVVLENGQLWHHWRDNSNLTAGWQRGGLVSPNASGPGSIIQSNLGTPGHFEVVVLEGSNLAHHWHDNANATSAWQNGKIVSVAATGPGSLIQSSYGPGGQGNFEVLAQELTQSVVHYWFHNVDPSLPWWRGPRIEMEVEVPSKDLSVKISQVTGDYDRQLNRTTLSLTTRYGVVGTDLGSSFQHAGRICFLFGDTQTDGTIRSKSPQDMDTVAFTTTATPDNGIVIVCNPSYPKVDNIDQTTFCVPCDGVSVPPLPPGPAWMIQSSYGDPDHQTFEVVVLEGSSLVHWTHDNAHVTNPWRRNQIITSNATGGGCIIESRPSGNFEVVVPEGDQLGHYTLAASTPGAAWQKVDVVVASGVTGPGCIIQSSLGNPGNFEVVVLEGNQLWHHWFDNENPSSGWQRAGLVVSGATGPGCIIQSDFGSPGNFEVVVPENNELWHHWHDNSNTTSPWQRAGLVTGDATGPGCIIQSNFGSTDHGNFEVVVLQGGSVWHHWHDNSEVTSAWHPAGRVATNTTGPACLIQSNFGSTSHGNFEVVVPVGPVLQHFYHDNSDPTLPWTPAEIVSATSMYVFFTTDRINDPGTDSVSMGRCVLARSDDDGVSFGSSLFDLSTDKFINLSLQVVDNGTISGLPQRFGQGLLIWATGRYRASNVYLGYVPLASIEDRSAYLFYAGLSNGNQPVWVADEANAQSLFLSGNMGELCVRWNPFLREFIMAYNSDNGGLILARQSATPWGPWTVPESIFDYKSASGPTGFLNNPANNNGQGDTDDNDIGVPYAPYFIQPYTRANPDQSTTMFYLVSVHNPYQVELMSVRIRSRALVPQPPPPPPAPSPESGPFRGPGSIHDPAAVRA